MSSPHRSTHGYTLTEVSLDCREVREQKRFMFSKQLNEVVARRTPVLGPRLARTPLAAIEYGVVPAKRPGHSHFMTRGRKGRELCCFVRSYANTSLVQTLGYFTDSYDSGEKILNEK